VGSKGSKPRKPSHSQHLPKVGTKTENRRLLREEQHAIGETVGAGSVPWGLIVALTIVVLLVVTGLVGLLMR
jgi:hypothetical protein